MKKIILHLYADLGSDSRFYQLDDSYNEIDAGSMINYEKILSDLINRQNCKKVSYQRVVYKKRT